MPQLLVAAETTAIVTTSDAWIKLASVPYDKIKYNDVDAKNALKARLKRHPWLDPARPLSDAERRTVSRRLWECSDMRAERISSSHDNSLQTMCWSWISPAWRLMLFPAPFISFGICAGSYATAPKCVL